MPKDYSSDFISKFKTISWKVNLTRFNLSTSKRSLGASSCNIWYSRSMCWRLWDKISISVVLSLSVRDWKKYYGIIRSGNKLKISCRLQINIGPLIIHYYQTQWCRQMSAFQKALLINLEVETRTTNDHKKVK